MEKDSRQETSRSLSQSHRQVRTGRSSRVGAGSEDKKEQISGRLNQLDLMTQWLEDPEERRRVKITKPSERRTFSSEMAFT